MKKKLTELFNRVKNEFLSFSQNVGKTAVTSLESKPSQPSPNNMGSMSINSLSSLKAAYHSSSPIDEYERILDNLKALKILVEQPKESEPDSRFDALKLKLGDGESYETIRQDRWHPLVNCPSCHSQHIRRMPATLNPHNYRYHCLDCKYEFNDDSGMPFETTASTTQEDIEALEATSAEEKAVLPLATWMQCWYLMGFTTSYAYIASRLNLDLVIVEWMVAQLQRSFQAEQPLTHFVDYRERFKQSTIRQKQAHEEASLKKEELLNSANTPNAPKDTAEYRKQQEKRNDPSNFFKKGR